MVGDVTLAMQIVDEVVEGFTFSYLVATEFSVVLNKISPQFSKGGECFGFGDVSHVYVVLMLLRVLCAYVLRLVVKSPGGASTPQGTINLRGQADA
jgi:hypothetical protein